MKNSFNLRCRRLRITRNTKTAPHGHALSLNSWNLHAFIWTNYAFTSKKLLNITKIRPVTTRVRLSVQIFLRMKKRLKRCGANWCTVYAGVPQRRCSKLSTLCSQFWPLFNSWTSNSTSSSSWRSLNLSLFSQNFKKGLRSSTILNWSRNWEMHKAKMAISMKSNRTSWKL